MREIHSLHVEQSRRGILRRLRPLPHPTTGKPHVILDDKRRVWFEDSVQNNQEGVYWCFPTGKSNTFEDYYGLPINLLDPIHGICLLNTNIQIREGRTGFNDAAEAMGVVLDGLYKIRPDRILCAEGEYASKFLYDFLLSEGFRKGNPHVALDSVCYLGTFNGQDGRFMAQGIGGRVLVDGLTSNYIGPIYVSCDVTRPGQDNSQHTYKGFALPNIDGHLRKKLAGKYFQMGKTEDPVNTRVRQILGFE